MAHSERYRAYLDKAPLNDIERSRQFAVRISTLTRYLTKMNGEYFVHQRNGGIPDTFQPSVYLQQFAERYPEYINLSDQFKTLLARGLEDVDATEQAEYSKHRYEALQPLFSLLSGVVSRNTKDLSKFFEAEQADMDPPMLRFFEFMIPRHPLTGIVVFQEYVRRLKKKKGEQSEVVSRDKKGTRPLETPHESGGEWFIEMVEAAQDVAQNIMNFFDTWKARCVVDSNGIRARNFLDNWKQEEILKVVEYLNYATRQIINARSLRTPEECTQLYGIIPFHVDRGEFHLARKNVLKILEPVREGDKEIETLYSRMDKSVHITGLIQNFDPADRSIVVPVIVNISDMAYTMRRLQEYWYVLADSMNLETKYQTTKREDMDTIRLASDVWVDFRGNPVTDGVRTIKQARIRIRGKGALAFLSKRVDKEAGYLGLDDGGIDFHQTLAYAQEIRAQDAKKEPHFHPSIMKSKARGGGQGPVLTSENKMALIAAIVMSAGREFGMRAHLPMSHHSYEYINVPDHFDHFFEIAQTLHESLRGA